MEALNALRLKPISALPDQRAKPRKVFQIPTLPSPKFPNSSSPEANLQTWREKISKNIKGSLVLLASSLSANLANALTYEEALEQSLTTSTGGEDFDASSVLNTIADNPLLIAGGLAVIAVPLVLSQVLGSKPKPFGVASAKSAYAKLAEEPNALLLDIRSPKEVREVGSPDIRGLKKKPVSVAYNGEDKPGFLQKLSLRFKEPENTTLFILDKFDGDSELVAELVTANGFKAAYGVKDGAEGPRGWRSSSLPWVEPKKAFSLDISSFTDALNGAFDGGADALPVTLGLAAAAGLGVVTFTEIETVLQLLGSAALIQFVSKKFLFAEDRKQTLLQLDEFLTTKVAPNELVADIQQIGTALLPVSVNSRALPAPAEASSEGSTADSTVVKAEAAPEQSVEAAQPPASVNNSAPPTEVKAPSFPRAQSPFPAYPDFKPPSSPSPSRP